MCHGWTCTRRGAAARGPSVSQSLESRTASDLLQFIQVTMPPGIAGLLPADDYLSVAAFILETNGAPPASRR